MNFRHNCCIIFISIQILYLIHLPSIVCGKNKNDTDKLANMPLVLLKQSEEEYAFPRCFRQDPNSKKRDFTSASNESQVFFCPASSDKRLLFPTHGIHFHCKNQPIPTIRKMKTETSEKKCGKGRDLYSFEYQYSKTPLDDWDGQIYWKEIFAFCYDTNTEQIAYVRYRILSPNLLGHRELQRERSYYETVYRLDGFEDLVESLKKDVAMIITAMDEKETIEQPAKTESGNSADMTPISEQPAKTKSADSSDKELIRKYFTTMELGHPADMIFPNWKKPFYYPVNKGLLLRTLTKQWRKIGYFVRKLAQKKLGEIDIVAGTFPIPNTEFPAIFWKLVVYKEQAIAIILHNIFDPLTEQDKIDRKFNKKNNANSKNFKQKSKGVDLSSEKIPDANPDSANIASENSDTVTGFFGEEKVTVKKLCSDICLKVGFQGIISGDLKIPAYCCHPKVIINLLGSKDDYQLLNLKKTPRDPSVIDDRCPNDPLQVSDSKEETVLESSNKIEKS